MYVGTKNSWKDQDVPVSHDVLYAIREAVENRVTDPNAIYYENGLTFHPEEQ